MSEPIDELVQILRNLPENMQASVARAVRDYAATCEDEHLLA
jgi:hypothetical protein